MQSIGFDTLYILYTAAGMEPYARKDRVSFAPSQEEQNKEDKGGLKMHKPRGPLSKISFEDYHNTWSGIATSKWDTNSPNPCKFILTYIILSRSLLL